MTSINPVSGNMLQTYFNSLGSSASAPSKSATAPQTAPEIVKKDTADAVKAYSLVAPKPKNYDKKSLEELKTGLVQQGKIEGKDFKVEQDNLMSKLILLENDKPVKEYIYNQKGASKEDFETVREFGYPLDDKNGLQSIETTYGADGEFHFRTMNYDKEKSPYKNELVNFSTKSSEFRQYLKDNNIKFANDVDISNDIVTHKFIVFDPKADKMSKYVFTENEKGEPLYVSKSEIDNCGNTKNSIDFHEKTTSFTEFEDNCKY